ncbi:hypothetical protein ACFLWU_07090, partial [Chloroflexota bacterium]
EPPVILCMGEAGTPINNGIKSTSLCGLGCASGICTVIYPIDSLSRDFQEFNKCARECFVIDKQLLSKDTKGITIGVWAVPERNKISFGFNNPDVSTNLLYQVTYCEPQIWIYAIPSP